MTVALAYLGDGPEAGVPILFGSSIGSSSVMWEPQVARCSQSRRMIRFDHRGHGRSPLPEGPWEIEDLGADVIALMDAQGIAVADYVGLSLGGMVGMWLGANHPHRFRRLVLACTTAYMPPPELWITRAALVREQGMSAVMVSVFERWFTPTFMDAQQELIAPLKAQFLATAVDGYAECGLAISRMDLRPLLASITPPTLVISGAHDPATTPEVGQSLADAIPGARHVIVDSAHIASVEASAAVTDAILEHLLAHTP